MTIDSHSAFARFRVSIRELAEFCHRSGDLSPRQASPLREEGNIGHEQWQLQRLQAGWRCEVVVRDRLVHDGIRLTVSGRADCYQPDRACVEEIKTTFIEPNPAELPNHHWAQLKLYAHLLAQRSDHQDITLQMTYLRLKRYGKEREVEAENESSGATIINSHTFEQQHSAESLARFYQQTVDDYLAWLTQVHQWRRARQCYIDGLKFPFDEFRAGQKRLAAAVWHTLKQKDVLLSQAPTGLGKSLAVLFPVVKSLGTRCQAFFFATARNAGAQAAQQAVAILHDRQQLPLKVLHLQARHKMCFVEDAGCTTEHCVFRRGFFDRLPAARNAAFAQDNFTGDDLLRVAEEHRVCPHQLAAELSPWMDGLIGDYNYAFDPESRLEKWWQERGYQAALLVDEVHNLPARARDMFSASLDVVTAEQALEAANKSSAAHINAINAILQQLKRALGIARDLFSQQSDNQPRSLQKLDPDLLESVQNYLMHQAERMSENPSTVLSVEEERFFFDCWRFVARSGLFNASFRLDLHPETQRITINCLNPASLLKPFFLSSRASVLFSATAKPFHFLEQVTGLPPEPESTVDSAADSESKDGLLNDPSNNAPAEQASTQQSGSKKRRIKRTRTLTLPSPFPQQNQLTLLVNDIPVTYRYRQQSAPKLAQLISDFTQPCPGNVLVFFPSFAYLNQVAPLLKTERPLLQQSAQMSEAEKADFLKQFQSQKNLLALAVLGGSFAEAIDLPGTQLSGVMVVTLGLPQPNHDSETLTEYFNEQGLNGQDFVYTYPAMHKVLQAVGRLIRTEDDRGVVCLVDQRYQREPYQSLLPEYWHTIATSSAQTAELTHDFFNG